MLEEEHGVRLPKIVGLIDEKVIELLNLPIIAKTKIILGPTNYSHMQISHPDDFARYFQFLEEILAHPDFVNLNPKDQSIRYLKCFESYVTVGVRVSAKGTAFARTIFVIPEWKFKQYQSGGYLRAYK